MGLTYSDLNGITEVIPNKEYKIRTTTGSRLRKVVHGNLMKAITEKEKLIREAEKRQIEEPKKIKKIITSTTIEDAVIKTMNYLINLGENTDAIDLNTVFDYQDRINTYVYEFFPKDSKLSMLDENKIMDFVRYMFNKRRKDGNGLLSISSVEKTYSALSWIVRYCSEISDPPLLKENYLDKVIFKSLVPKGRKKIKKIRKTVDLSQLNNIIDKINEKANIRLKTMLNIFMDVGCRPEECLGFKWSNIDLVTGRVIYDEAVTSSITKKNSSKHCGTRVKELKSANSYRENFLSIHTIECLNNLKILKKALGLSVNNNDYIFTIWSDNTILSPISLEDEYKDFRIKHKLPDIKLYDFRHSISNLLQESGVSLKDISLYLGNTPRTIAESYTQIREETEQRIHQIINDKSRFNKHQKFDIDLIVQILNFNDCDVDKNVYEILDFVVNKKVEFDDISWAIENTKNLILEQHPSLKIFCNEDENIIQAKLETYKMFNSNDIELIQNPNYYFPSIKL